MIRIDNGVRCDPIRQAKPGATTWNGISVCGADAAAIMEAPEQEMRAGMHCPYPIEQLPD